MVDLGEGINDGDIRSRIIAARETTQAKLMSFPKVEGIVFGNWGEVSEATHTLVDVIATCRVRVAEPETDRKDRQIGKT